MIIILFNFRFRINNLFLKYFYFFLNLCLYIKSVVGRRGIVFVCEVVGMGIFGFGFMVRGFVIMRGSFIIFGFRILGRIFGFFICGCFGLD